MVGFLPLTGAIDSAAPFAVGLYLLPLLKKLRHYWCITLPAATFPPLFQRLPKPPWTPLMCPRRMATMMMMTAMIQSALLRALTILLIEALLVVFPTTVVMRPLER